jgi:hypothetical protein
MKPIDNVQDYIAAIAKRQHYRQMLARGARQFAGYGLELFQGGINATLCDLDAAIEGYEVTVGYTRLAPTSFWAKRMKEEMTAGTVWTFQPGPVVNDIDSPQQRSVIFYGMAIEVPAVA